MISANPINKIRWFRRTKGPVMQGGFLPFIAESRLCYSSGAVRWTKKSRLESLLTWDEMTCFCENRAKTSVTPAGSEGQWLMLNLNLNLNHVNTLRPRQNERLFADDILKCIFLNENVWIPIEISLRFVPKGPNWQYSSFGLDNGLAPSRRQAIIWTNDG